MGKPLQLVKIWCAALFFLCLIAGAACAFEEAVIGQAERAALAYRADLQTIDSELGLAAITEQRLIDHRNTLEDIRVKALGQSGTLDEPIKEIAEQVAKLGPAPAERQTEAKEIEAQRKLLNDTLNRLQGAKTQLELVAVEAEQQSGRASSIQRNQFFQKIFESSKSILNPYLWSDAGTGLTVFLQRLGALIGNWWNQVQHTASASSLLLLPLIIVLILGVWWFTGRVLQERYKARSLESDFPGNLDRLWRVVRVTLGTLILVAIIFSVILSYLQNAGFVTARFNLILDGLAAIITGTVVNGVLAYRVASPKQPNWRLINLDDAAASRFAILATICAAMSGASDAFSNLADGIFLPVSYSIGQSALVSSLMLILLALLLLNFRNQPGLVEKPPNQLLYFQWSHVLLAPTWLLVISATIALLFGYIALANLIVFKLFDTGLFVTFLFLIHYTIDAAVRTSSDPNSQLGKFIRRVSGLGERAIERAGLLFRTVFDIILVLIGLPILHLLWTVTWIDFRALANRAFFGFDVGNVTVSPWSILLVALVLFSGIAITKLFVGWLNRRILLETRIDKGVQDSVRKGATYAGYIIAAGFALTAAGLEFSNLALIAGALGVGIGFGLQSIVNNFVSGLILLAERPIRVGDWVSIPAGEGLVKKINVRATEIETFDGCSIIVPNSNLITESVKNWTHSDTMGRFTVNVSVAYDSDAEKVKELLLQLTKAHPNVLTYPEPVVTLQKFGIYSLDFEIKGTVGDIFYGVFVASDVRFAILRAFAEKGIVIPQPSLVSVQR
jgi:potassium-dependent mechanosensitive channel